MGETPYRILDARYETLDGRLTVLDPCPVG